MNEGFKLVIIVYTHSCKIHESEVGKLLWIQGQLELHMSIYDLIWTNFYDGCDMLV